MAVKGSGTVAKTIDPPMKDQTSSNIARDGAAKKVQDKFAVHPGMKSRIAYKGAAPSNPGSGPDASSPNVMDPEPSTKKYAKPANAWGMLDANKQSVNHDLGQAVLDEAKLAVQYSGDKSRAADAAK